MRLRPYIHCLDFETLRKWMTDERTHSLWSAGRFPFPLEGNSFRQSLDDIALRSCDAPFIATDDDGKPVGFFCYSVNPASNEGMLKFVMIDSSLRGKGYGRQMIELAVSYAFQFTGAEAVILNVFSVNEAAKHCYLSAGFTVRTETPDAFAYKNESWGRCNMIIHKA
ncbi:MAG: GNAT family N-acetyltransferase [Ruminococcus sp.]|nr:GNAT family N-acetyltransferase [Ruminococcus sp.]